MTLAILNLFCALFAVALAFRFGGEEERHGARVVTVMCMVALAGRIHHHSVFHQLDPLAFAQDVIGFLGFAWLGIFRKRIWPLWAAAFQLLSVGAHLIRALELAVRPIVYAWMKSGPTWAVFILLLVGTLGHRRRMSMSASVRSWPS